MLPDSRHFFWPFIFVPEWVQRWPGSVFLACSRGTLVHDPPISIGRNGSSFTILQPWRGSRYLCLEPLLLHETQHFPCSPKGYKPKANLNSSPYSHLNPAVQAVLQSLWQVPKSPSSGSSPVLQDLGHVVISLCVIIVQESMCCGALDHGEVQERHKSRDSRQSVFARQQVSVLPGRV